MKIAQITYSGFGGLGSVVFSLISADSQHKYDWAVGFFGDQELDAAYEALCKQYSVGFESFCTVPNRRYQAWLELSRWLDVERPDVVICHSITAILPCRWYAWRRGARLIAVEHTPNQVKTRNEWAGSRMAMLLADRVVVLTDEYKEELRQAHGWLFRPDKVAVIPNGIDTDIFSPKQDLTKSTDKDVRIGMAARFSFSKRQDLLVDALERLKQLRPDFSIKLVFAGDGSELERVKSLASNSAVSSYIQFDGLLSEADVAPWLRELDIYVHATEGETLSTSLLQAMATGLPIVASDIPGVHNLLGAKKEYGCCVPNEASHFVDSILDLIDDPSERIALGQRARAEVIESYSNEVMLQRYLDVIQVPKMTMVQKR